MHYYNWRTGSDKAKKCFPETRGLPLLERFRIESDRIATGDSSCILWPEWKVCAVLERLAHEFLWFKAGSPYYQIHPRIVPHLCRCRLDTIPSTYLEVPGGFDVVCVRFAEAHPEMYVNEGEHVRVIVLAKALFPGLDQGQITSLWKYGCRPKKLDEPSDRLILLTDIGRLGDCDGVTDTTDWTFVFKLDRARTLEEVFAQPLDSASERYIPSDGLREAAKNCLRLVANVGFMANTPEEGFLEYDVLSKDRPAFAQANSERKAQLIQRAHRRGKIGWNVGTSEMFLGQMPRWSNQRLPDHERELSHAHIRSGHLHAVRYGEGRRAVKLKWFRPTIVRPDLPFA